MFRCSECLRQIQDYQPIYREWDRSFCSTACRNGEPSLSQTDEEKDARDSQYSPSSSSASCGAAVSSEWITHWIGGRIMSLLLVQPSLLWDAAWNNIL